MDKASFLGSVNEVVRYINGEPGLKVPRAHLRLAHPVAPTMQF